MPTDSGLLTMREAATLAGRTMSTISLWARRGHIPHTRVRLNYRWVLLFHPDDVARVSSVKERICKERNYRNASVASEETMEDVERIIAEQMLCLPKWFHNDTTKMQGMRVKDLVRCKDDEFDDE